MQIKDQIKNFIANELVGNNNHIELNIDTMLIENGIIDSLGIIKLLTFLEEKYKIKIENEDLIPENFENINTITFLIEKQIS